MYFASLRYTSPTFLESIINTIAFLTFVIAVVLSPSGLAKVWGTVVSLAGVLTMTLYKGPIVKNLRRPLIHIHEKSSKHENWLKGSILTVSLLTQTIVQLLDHIQPLQNMHMSRSSPTRLIEI
ncbi:auxin-induced protein 5NG4-like [Pyrus ussuriensis x Pyrus communis]|uniref:Auxin-induced protein 5NG4-like n=1 Tax=Pyrus ussuriensis x Pyrus communis TaxID=2448454 RepID=A0A5N5F9S2_9ROSA|nr:auxin-induced protein 5NG4-like [Pyrus ussuriensis x Pyrus communis]